MKRTIFSILLLLSPAFLPWWLIIICGIVLSIYFEHYFELIIVGIIMDSLYGERFEILHTKFVFTILSLILFFIILKIRKNLRY